MDHEVRNQPVEEGAIVIAGSAEGKEVLGVVRFDLFQEMLGVEIAYVYLCCFGHALAENLYLDIAEVCVKSDGHAGQEGLWQCSMIEERFK